MDSHSETQSLLLKRMGIDVWKLRHSEADSDVEKPVSAAPEIRSTVAPQPDSDPVSKPSEDGQSVSGSEIKSATTAAIGETEEAFNASDDAKLEQIADSGASSVEKSDVPSASMEPATSISTTTQTTASFSDTDLNTDIEFNGAVADWSATAIHTPGAQWCFVCALSAETEKAERKLFDAILFALGLTVSDCSLIWSSPVFENEDVQASGSGVTETLASLLEQNPPRNIIVLGEKLAQFLIGTDKTMDVLRNESYRYQGGSSQLFVTDGLAHMLTNPLDKARVWQDLLKAKSAIS